MSLARRWTLRRTLVVGASVLVAVAFLVTSIIAVSTLRVAVLERLDAQVLAGLDFADELHGPPGEDGGDDPAPPAAPAARVGTLQVVLGPEGDVRRAEYAAADGSAIPLATSQLEIVRATVIDGRLPLRMPITVELGGEVGSVRLAADTRHEYTLVSGSSLGDVEATVAAIAGILAAVMGSALLLVVLGIAFVVTRALRPLDRVAATAQRVAERPLAEGAVELPERVRERDTDPRTEVGRVGLALNTLLTHMEASLSSRHRSEEQLRRFIADASHELRTPLASIQGYAQLSQAEAAPMTPTQERSLERIEAEAVRMSALVDDLLLLARLDAGQPLRRDTVDVALVLMDAVSDAHAASPDHVWILDVDEAIEVHGDEARLRQVLVNLLGNARIHTPPGTTVTASLVREPEHALVRIADNGPGIEPALLERLFERFARGDDSRQRATGCTGLGLSISRAIVLAHGGEVSVESGSSGTVFTVRLPLQQAPSAHADDAVAPTQPA